VSVLLVGPDGTGKSTIAERLASSDGLGVVETGHYRPGILWERSPEVTVTPHAERRRSVVASFVKLVAVFVDFVLGHVGPWRRTGRSGVIVLERGWWDHVADPVRYRLPTQLSGMAEILGRCLPRADLVVILSGDPAAIVARKPELGEEEVAAQLDRWRVLAPRAGHRVLELDTVSFSPEETVARIRNALSVTRERWIAVPGTPRRNHVVATTGSAGRAAVGVYRPNSLRARSVAPLVKAVVQLGWWRRAPRPEPVHETLADRAGLAGTVGMASTTSPGRSRVVVGLARPGELLAVAKIGLLDDAGLRHEAAVLRELQAGQTQLRTPQLRFVGEVDNRFVVIADAVIHNGPPVTRTEIGPVLRALEDAGERGLVHGDLAPWNLVRTADGTVAVLDFEYATWGSSPGFDLCHFLVQSGALLGRFSPAEVLDELDRCLRGSSRSTADLVHDYRCVRRDRADASAKEQRFSRELEKLVRSREVGPAHASDDPTEKTVTDE
jgi:hypothetical protein